MAHEMATYVDEMCQVQVIPVPGLEGLEFGDGSRLYSGPNHRLDDSAMALFHRSFELRVSGFRV